MKKVTTTKRGDHFTAVNVGKLSDIKDYSLDMGGGVVVPGKVFVGSDLQTTGAELSFQSMVPGQDTGFLHTHKHHEELYFILSGEGLFQVDDEQISISEGSIVRVSPDGKRALKNTGTTPLVMLCIQYQSASFGKDDSPMVDGVILNNPLKW